MESKGNIHIVWVLANNSTAPYFNWFAERATKDPSVKMSFVCLYPERPRMIDDMKAYGYDCYWIKYDHTRRKWQMPWATLKLRRLLKKLKPDIVHTHLFDDSLMGLIAEKKVGVKGRFITKGDTGFHYYYTPRWVWLDRLNNRNATHIIAISSESQKFIIEREQADISKVHLIHHGIPIRQLTTSSEKDKDALTKKYNLSGRIVIGTIARFIEWKGYKTIIAAAEKLVKENSNLLFLLIGKGDQRNEIEQMVAEKKLGNHVAFIDWVDPQQLPSLYQLMNIYLHAAKNEPFGLVIAEALANGVPVVSTKTGAALDAIEHKKSGYLCDYEKPEEILEGIKYVLNNNTGNTIGLAGRQAAEKMYTVELMYQKHIELYKKALGNK